MSFPRHLRALLRTSPDKGNFEVKKREIDGRKAECVLFTPTDSGSSQEYCFDEENAALVSVRNTMWSNWSNVEYSNFATFNGKSFPGTIQLKRGDRAEAEFHLDGISPLGRMDPKTFDAPPNAKLWGQCMDGEDPKELHATPPQYPMEMKMEHITGNVYVYAVIGIDGTLHDMKVLPGSEQRLAPSTMSALSTWNYTPASCGDAPLPAETLVVMTYTIEE